MSKIKEQDFSKVKVGQRLWSIQLGWCEVIDVSHNYEYIYPIECQAIDDSNDIKHYTIDGKCDADDAFPSLFWSNPFEAGYPEKPREYMDGYAALKAMEGKHNIIAKLEGEKTIMKLNCGTFWIDTPMPCGGVSSSCKLSHKFLSQDRFYLEEA